MAALAQQQDIRCWATRTASVSLLKSGRWLGLRSSWPQLQLQALARRDILFLGCLHSSSGIPKSWQRTRVESRPGGPQPWPGQPALPSQPVGLPRVQRMFASAPSTRFGFHQRGTISLGPPLEGRKCGATFGAARSLLARKRHFHQSLRSTGIRSPSSNSQYGITTKAYLDHAVRMMHD